MHILRISLLIVSTLTTTVAAAQTHVSVEVDPTTFVLNGYSLHLRIQPPNCERVLLGAGVYSLKLPRAFIDLNSKNRDEGWRTKINFAYALFGEYYFQKANSKWFIGEQVSIQKFSLSNSQFDGHTTFDNLLVFTYLGYCWKPFSFPLYLKPWAGLGYTTTIKSTSDLSGKHYSVAPLFPFATFHLGYTF